MHPINAQFITILMISYLNVIQLPLYTALCPQISKGFVPWLDGFLTL